MKNEKNLLTIAIPAYNRVETLEKLIIQLKFQSDQNFNLLILDDASPDNHAIELMVSKYKKQMPNLVFNRNTENLGFSGNICKLYELATTRYIWFMCDDDTVFSDAVRNINDSLKKYQPVVAIYNHTWVTPYGVKLVAGPDRNIVYENLLNFKDYQPFMRTTFLSSLVLERRLDISKVKETNYTDNVFVQMTISLLLLSDKFRLCEIAIPVLHRNVGYNYGDFYKFYLVDILKAVYAIDHNLDNNLVVKFMKGEIFNGLKLYLSQKLGLFNYTMVPTKETVNLISKYYGNFKYFIFSFKYIYMFTPSLLLKGIYLVQLVFIHGIIRGLKVYNKNINRAYTDLRKTGFTNYK